MASVLVEQLQPTFGFSANEDLSPLLTGCDPYLSLPSDGDVEDNPATLLTNSTAAAINPCSIILDSVLPKLSEFNFEAPFLSMYFPKVKIEKPFSCEVCHKQFKNKSYLKVHMRIHRGEKVCRCLWCDYTCCDRSNMRKHFRIHTGEKPFQCTVCGRGFAQSGSLKRHVRTHLKQKPSRSRSKHERCFLNHKAASKRRRERNSTKANN